MSDAPPIDDTTKSRQGIASNPDLSAWVGANAGSGKTYVLSRRVIRLLLKGVEPSKILCLTFTKAAAAEMSERVFKALSAWVTAEEARLRLDLASLLDGSVTPAHLVHARQLFAKALETPGGLKIQTIHAFCERLLHQFPVEANVAGHFEVLDDHGRAALIRQAERDMLMAIHEDPLGELAMSLNHVIKNISDGGYRGALYTCLAQARDIETWLQKSGGLNAAMVTLRKRFGLSENETTAGLEDQMADLPDLSTELMQALAQSFHSASTRYQAQGAVLEKFLKAQTQNERKQATFELLLTKELKPKSKTFLAQKVLFEERPDFAEPLLRAQTRLVELLEKSKILNTLEMTRAVLTLGLKVISLYSHQKAQRGLMDFDDLIEKAAALLETPDAAAWVHYKLDQGLDHILVDEAQDTSPRQWDIIAHLADEFFVGESARTVDRTIFAVGDEKQSIYSFQGASPEWFSKMRKRFQRAADQCEARFEVVPLSLSFRSTGDVLDVVDLVFDQGAMRARLTDGDYHPHQAVRRNEVGFVELWPSFQRPANLDHDGPWWKPLDELGENSAEIKLAQALSERIQQMLDHEEPLPGGGRPITAGDILILTRKRGALVDAISRALKTTGVPVAGSDRLKLAHSIAVQDLMALVDFVLLSEDDLALAGLLKSPLIGLSEEDLFHLSHGRKGTLWRALADRSQKKEAPFREAHEKLSRWRQEADYAPPFDFFMNVLARDRGRDAFLQKLGQEVEEILEAFLLEVLTFEQSEIPSLQGFAGWFRAASVEIKRDMENVSNKVRIMTVHGSKGLEAPIVFLVDHGRPVHSSHLPDLLTIDEEGSPAFLWRQPKNLESEIQSRAREAEQQSALDEYYRLLYVAMTRAADRLYLLNIANAKGEAEKGSWYDVVFDAISASRYCQSIKDENGQDQAWRWQISPQGVVPAPAPLATGAQERDQELPEWLFRDVTMTPPLLPSLSASQTVGRDDERAGDGNEFFVEEADPLSAIEPRVRGTLMHRLFERLPEVAREERGLAAQRFLSAELPQADPTARDALAGEVLQILDTAELAWIFSNKEARSEVPMNGILSLHGQNVAIRGEVDRLIVGADTVHIIDYKTNRSVPQQVNQVPIAYRRQLALYQKLLSPLFPGRKILTSLLWTRTAKCMHLPQATLDEALNTLIHPHELLPASDEVL